MLWILLWGTIRFLLLSREWYDDYEFPCVMIDIEGLARDGMESDIWIHWKRRCWVHHFLHFDLPINTRARQSMTIYYLMNMPRSSLICFLVWTLCTTLGMAAKLALLENLRLLKPQWIRRFLNLQVSIIFFRSLSHPSTYLLQSDLSTYDPPQRLPLSSKLTAGALNMLVQELVAAMEQLTGWFYQRHEPKMNLIKQRVRANRINTGLLV